MLRLCNQIDALWDAHTQLRAEIKDKTTDPLSVWGQAQDEEHSTPEEAIGWAAEQFKQIFHITEA